MLTNNAIKMKLGQGEPVLGTWNTLASPLVTEVLAQAGLDFQIIDLEHGPFILSQLNLHVSACEDAQGCTPIVRIPANESWMALQALDQGAYGVVVPHIKRKTDAEQFVSSIKYHPLGDRGFTPFSKAGGFSNIASDKYVERANKQVLSVVIIESMDGLDNLDEIIEVDGVDVIYFGAYDLSQALGHPGEVRHPEVVAAINRGVDIVTKGGKSAGGFVPQTKDDVKWLLDMGMRFITYQVDCSILHSHVAGMTDWFASELKK